MLNENEEVILRKWLAWQKQASKTNDVSFVMDERLKDLRASYGDQLTADIVNNDQIFKDLQVLHDLEAEKCGPLMKDFKEAVKNGSE